MIQKAYKYEKNIGSHQTMNERSGRINSDKNERHHRKTRRYRRMRAASVMLCLILLVLSGCSGNGGNSSQNKAASADDSKSSTNEEQSAQAGAIGEQTEGVSSQEVAQQPISDPVTITLAHDLDALHEEILKGLTDVFNTTNQEGITVNLVRSAGFTTKNGDMTDAALDAEDEGEAGNADTKSDTALTAGEDVDILLADVREMEVLAQTVSSVDDFLTEHPENFRQYRTEFVDASSVTGVVYGIPFSVQADVCFYNAAMLAEAGALVPTDTDSFFTSAEQVMDKRHVPLLGVCLGTDADTSFLEDVLRGYGVLLTATSKDYQSRSGDLAAESLDLGQGESAVSVLLKLYRGGFIRTYEDASRMRGDYLNGSIGGYLGTSDDLTYMQSERFETTPALLPFGTNQASSVMMQDLFVLTDEDTKRAAVHNFLSYLTSENTLTLWAVGTGDLPVTRASFEFKEYRTFMDTDAVSCVMADERVAFYFADWAQEAEELRKALSHQLSRHTEDEVTAQEILDVLREESDESESKD